MNWPRTFAIAILLLVGFGCVFAELLAPSGYTHQFRDIPDAIPSRQHWLGTDTLGRDRFSRVLYGTRVSLVLAPAAALCCSLLAAIIGATAGFLGAWVERTLMTATDLFLSLPWLFLLLTVRALLPLNVSPWTSVVITFALLASLGWAAAARVICADARTIRNSDFMLLARASGLTESRVLWVHLIPNLMPLLYTQFWIAIPVFILTEANLGMLGLGVSEPLPSWGTLLREIERYSSLSNGWQLAPLLLLILVVSCFELLMPDRELSI
jgi:peptide/nickel transport system permease protein